MGMMRNNNKISLFRLLLRALPSKDHPLHPGVQRNKHSIPCFEESLNTFTDTKFVPLRIRGFMLGDSFNRATIDFTEEMVDKDGNSVDNATVHLEKMKKTEVFTPTIRFSTLFSVGLQQLQLFSSGHNLTNINLNYAIYALIATFWNQKEFHESCLREMIVTGTILDNENDVTLMLANHLFSRLTPYDGHTSYRVDVHRQKPLYCPCGICDNKIHYGNNGIGSEYLWYGFSDIVLFPPGGSNVRVVTPQLEEDFSMPFEDRQKQILEVKLDSKSLRTKYNESQCLAHVLTAVLHHKVYEMRKKRKSPSNLKARFMPTIAVSAESYDLYLYDMENDILLRNRGDPIPLWSRRNNKDVLNDSSILMMWMVINHLVLDPKISKSAVESLKGSCNFFSQFSASELKKLESTIRMKQSFKPLNSKLDNHMSTEFEFSDDCQTPPMEPADDDK